MTATAHDPATGYFKTKLTEDVVASIVKGIERCLAPEGAARLAGVSARSFHNWMSEGRRWLDEPGRTDDDVMIPQAAFVIRVEYALEVQKSELIRTAVSAKDARVTLEILARRFPREWGRKDHLEIGMQDPRLALLVPLLKSRGLDPSRLSPEKLDLFIDLCVEMAPDTGVVEVPRRALDA